MCLRVSGWAAGPILLGLLSTPVGAGPDSGPADDRQRMLERIQRLRSSHDEERRRAAEEIAALVRQAQSAAAPLIQTALDRNGKPNEATLKALAQLGPAAVPALTRALWDEDDRTRALALYALRGMGVSARPVIPSLIEMLKDDKPMFRRLAAEALAGTGARPACAALLPMLRDEDVGVRESVAAGLLHLDVEAKVILPVLTAWLKAKEAGDRRMAAVALCRLGREAAPAVPDLVKAMRDEDAQVRAAAVRSLGAVGPAALEAVPALTAALEDEKWSDDRIAVAEALARVGPNPDVAASVKRWLKDGGPRRVEAARLLWRIDRSPEAVTALAEVLRSGEAGDRRSAAEALRQIGPGAKAALPDLAASLKEKDFVLRASAVRALGRLGEDAKPAARELEPLLNDEDISIRVVAAVALWQVAKDPRAFPIFTAALKDEDAQVRGFAAWWLGHIGAPAKDTLPALQKALTDPEARVRLDAAEAMFLINQHGAARGAAARALQAEDPEVRADAAGRLGYVFGVRAKPAIPQLVQALWDDDAFVRSCAAEALGRIGPEAKEAIPALTVVLKTEGGEDSAYSAAAEALGRIGPEARSAVPFLRAMLQHPDSYVRVNAALALWHIDKNRSGLPVVTAGLGDRKARVRAYAAEALWLMRQDRRAVSVLLDVLRDADFSDAPAANNERYIAARALGRIGPPAKAALSSLLHLLSNEDPLLCKTVVEAVKQIDAGSALREKVP